MSRFFRSCSRAATFSDYRSYKPYLRLDFCHRSAYCGMTERYLVTLTVFGVDHFRPRSHFPHLDCVYSNLYYCCNDCNRYKGVVWPSEERQSRGFFFPDPCECDPYVVHYRDEPDGRLAPITEAGQLAIEVLRLNREPCVRFRQRRKQTGERIRRCRQELASIQATPELRELLNAILADLEAEFLECYYDPGDAG